jgi:LTXXQ motif family protein
MRFASHSFRHGGANFSQIRNAAVRPAHFGNAMNALSHSGALRNGRLLSNPAARAQIAAAAALAGWHGGGGGGWWQHAGGGYGWVGPLFWPFAYNDIYDYTIWGDGMGFWGYGYPDIYAGIFAPYGYAGLADYLPRRSQGRHARNVPLGELCGSDRREIAGLPIDQIADAVQPTEAQGQALDELGNASIQASGLIRASCPTEVAATAPGRLAAMQRRVEAMMSAVILVQPALEKFYGSLSDEQKQRFNALAEDQRRMATSRNGDTALVGNCGAQASNLSWPHKEIEEKLHLDDTQRGALQVVEDASADVNAALKAACQPDDLLTPPARLAAIRKRLDSMLEGVKHVRDALEDFYATLSDEQKAQFEAIGPRRTS